MIKQAKHVHKYALLVNLRIVFQENAILVKMIVIYQILKVLVILI